ncbi:hypothetical protein BLA39750_02582 [Burkholderia lata]|uniref:Uncharacterized protein n=2 Tax=Burkholderia lata (strain ATCC 17760 / DSM 23089 / LMG 22485 / NCIMB 9086 / R18194 / 383) TaxID=482957 RepID=A0A6P2WWT3_BURL3|nr:hypothetical protein BLA39750_02582 [Burkholderia lata]
MHLFQLVPNFRGYDKRRHKEAWVFVRCFMFDIYWMMDISLIKTILAFIPPVVGLIAKGPDIVKAIRRWKSNRHRKREAAVYREMKVLKSYQENPVILVAVGNRELLMCGLLLVGFMLAAIVAASPSRSGWDLTASLMLAFESLCMLSGAVYLFNGVASRLNSARNPHRSMVLYEIKIMKIRLDRAEAEIRKRTDPLLESDLQALRSLGAKLPGWWDK